MKKINNLLLSGVLGLVSAATLINTLTMFWIAYMFPISSFTAVRMVTLAFVIDDYALIIFTLLVCAILALTIISVFKEQKLLPILSLGYTVCDFFVVLNLVIQRLGDGYWTTYVVYAIVDIVLIVLLCVYLFGKTGDGSVS